MRKKIKKACVARFLKNSYGEEKLEFVAELKHAIIEKFQGFLEENQQEFTVFIEFLLKTMNNAYNFIKIYQKLVKNSFELEYQELAAEFTEESSLEEMLRNLSKSLEVFPFFKLH